MMYDVVCPVCGKVNRSLYLEETDGWMECVYCGAATRRKEHGSARQTDRSRMIFPLPSAAYPAYPAYPAHPAR